jgi:FAD/FMN-containing dehydrogenase
MRGIKDVFDPHGILNPGKVLRAASDVGLGH